MLEIIRSLFNKKQVLDVEQTNILQNVENESITFEKPMALENSTYSIPPSKGRRFAFGDVHGCFKTLMVLLNTIKATDDDQLFFLGDMIDRGKYSEMVLDYFIHGMQKQKNIFCLRGNHEQFLLNILDKIDDEASQTHITKNNLMFLFDRNNMMHQKYYSFFNTLPYYFELPNQFLVHSGFNFTGNPYENTEAMLSIRDFKPDMHFLGKRSFIIGHTPIPLVDIQKAAASHAPVINIDNGCVFGQRYPDKGNLVCIDLDSYEVYYQKNCE
jgi:serine/threonine protein phosphatase 1